MNSLFAPRQQCLLPPTCRVEGNWLRLLTRFFDHVQEECSERLGNRKYLPRIIDRRLMVQRASTRASSWKAKPRRCLGALARGADDDFENVVVNLCPG